MDTNGPALTAAAALASARSLWAEADRLTCAGEARRATHAVELARTREAEARRLNGGTLPSMGVHPGSSLARMVAAGALRSPLD